MTTDREVTRLVQSWLRTDEHESADRVLEGVLDLLDATPQRPLTWWQARRKFSMGGTMKLAAAALTVVVATAAALALYLNRSDQPPAATPTAQVTPQPSPSSTADVTAEPSPSEPGVVSKPPWVIFGWVDGSFDTLAMAMRADGSQVHQIWGGNGPPNFDWTADGRQLVAIDRSRIFLAQVDDDIGPFVDTGITTGTCAESPCGHTAVDISPDGEHVVFVQMCPLEEPCWVLTTVDLTTGERTQLSDTFGDSYHPLASPQFSPDGSQIAFTREFVGTDGSSTLASRLFVINADGTNLHEVDLGDGLSPYVRTPTWSPDGSRIAFAQADDILVVELATGEVTSVQSCCAQHWGWPEWISPNVIRIREAGVHPDNRFFVTEVVNAQSPDDANRLALYADLNDGVEAIEPPGEVNTSFYPGEAGQIYWWQPAPDWPANIAWESVTPE